MSRQEWFEKAKRSGGDLDNLVGSGEHLLSEKTDDPEARDYDEALILFMSGLKLGRRGDLEAAAPKIACAFLLNGRSISFIPKIPDNPADQKKKDKVLDLELLLALTSATAETETETESYACSVLRIITGQFLGQNPEHGQALIASAMTAIERLLEIILNDPSIENPDNIILGGCLTRANLFFYRSSCHMAMGNRKRAIKDLSKCLKVDEFYTKAREARGYLWASYNLKDDQTIHGEFTRVASEFHPDNRGMEGVYAWLAITTLNDPSLGSVEDAKIHFNKCLRATIRKDELYGPTQRRIDELPSCVQKAYTLFQQHPHHGRNRQRNLNEMIQGMRGISVDEYEEGMRKNKYICVKCGANRRPDGKMVMQCTRCKSVSYCSTKCQKADWKSHKSFCDTMKNKS